MIAAICVFPVYTTAQVDPEGFQFGNHWPSFLELAARALDSAHPAVHEQVLAKTVRARVAWGGGGCQTSSVGCRGMIIAN